MDINKYIPTDKAKNLYVMLKNIRDDNNFIMGVLTQLDNDEQRNIVIEEIENGVTDCVTLVFMASAISEIYSK